VIQVCSQCGTRWNVRERRREWCPRCRGALLAPTADAPAADPRWSTHGSQQSTAGSPVAQRTPPPLPPGFRWIAVRPGAAPPARPGRRPLGPTPRYPVIPRWTLTDRVEQTPAAAETSTRTGPSAAAVRLALFVSVLVLAGAALVYVARYVLLVINRKTLLNSIVATTADYLGDLASVAAIAALITSGVFLIQWLIARRAAVFSHYGLADQRSVRALWAGCVVPLANLLWAPVYVIELAAIEEHYSRLRRPILEWWIAWVASYLVSIWAIATSFTSDPQGIANNTVLMVFGYLFAAATLAAIARVFEGFVRKPVARPAHRWVVVTPDLPHRPDRPGEAASGAPVELEGEEPAA
jgi:branched-subunit amino acid transport protein